MDHVRQKEDCTPAGTGSDTTYQEPSTIPCTLHSTTVQVYTDINLDKKKKGTEELRSKH